MKKLSLHNRIFISQLAQIIFLLALVYITFLVMAMDRDLTTYSVAALLNHVERSLFRILLLAICLSAFFSYRIAHSISKPIRDLSRLAEKMSHMEFVPEQVKSSSPEIAILNDKFNEMANQISSYYRERNSFLQNISHELKTPLMSIHGYAEAVREGIEEDINEAMSIVMEESENLTSMVNQLLTLSKRDAFIGQPELSNLEIGEEIPHILKMVEGLAKKNKIKISYCNQGDPLVCPMGKDVLRIVLSNLLSNSLRYAKQQVDVCLSSQGEFAVLTILDDGGGIRPDQIGRIFERDYTGKGGMYGLGLHIVQKTLEGVSGSVEVCNAEKGSCFTVKIPLADPFKGYPNT